MHRLDAETHARVQALIRSRFDGCTILMVAHRLDSLLNVDRVVVLDGGRIVEDGCPMTLLAEKTSFFAKQFCGEPRDL